MTRAAGQLGGLDIVFANAGIGGVTRLGQTRADGGAVDAPAGTRSFPTLFRRES